MQQPTAGVATLNLNGLRSALRRGLEGWLAREGPDVLLLQEVRAEPRAQLFADLGYHSAWAPAEKAGYSGVALLSRRAPDAVELGLDRAAFDAEGRVLLARFGDLGVASVYVPSGSSGELRQAFKEEFLEHFAAWTRAQLARGPLLIGGDFNVAHQAADLKNWRANQRHSGFLPQERAWFGRLLASGLRDVHRETLGERAEYTWWSNRSGAYANDVGWRLDYLLAGGLDLRAARVQRAALLSDHAPLSALLHGPERAVRALSAAGGPDAILNAAETGAAPKRVGAPASKRRTS